MKQLHHSRYSKVQRTQAENCEYIRRVDDEWVPRNCKHGRNRIGGEENVGCLDYQQHDKQRRSETLCPVRDEEFISVVAFAHSQKFTRQAQFHISSGIYLFVLAFAGRPKPTI